MMLKILFEGFDFATGMIPEWSVSSDLRLYFTWVEGENDCFARYPAAFQVCDRKSESLRPGRPVDRTDLLSFSPSFRMFTEL